MSAISTPAPPIETLADLLDRLGNIPTNRIRWQPYPGTATEKDLVDAVERKDRICELIEGVLVEKPMAYRESSLAIWLAILLDRIVRPANLGLLTGADGTFKLFPGLIRIPDVAFTAWDRIPGRKMPTARVPAMAPNLAIEILCPSNTDAEMERKRTDYFSSGVELVWIINPTTRTVAVYTSIEPDAILGENDQLDGGSVLPGFLISVKDLFAELDRHG